MQDINLYHLLKFYAKKWLWIVIFTIVGASAGFIYNNYIQVPLYKSDATLLLVSTDDRKIGQDSTLINNYIQLLKSRRVLEPVINQHHLDISYEELVNSTTAINEKDTEVIKVSIDSNNAQTSKDLVDGVVLSFKNEVKKIYNLDNINVVDTASKAASPYNVRTTMLIGLSAATGFLIATVLLFLAYDLSLAKQAARKPNNKKITGRPLRQGGLLNKVLDLLIGTEVQPITEKRVIEPISADLKQMNKAERKN